MACAVGCRVLDLTPKGVAGCSHGWPSALRLRLEESDARHRGTRGSEGSSIQLAPEGATEAVQVQSRDFAQPVRATRGVRLRDLCRGRPVAARRRPGVPLAGRHPLRFTRGYSPAPLSGRKASHAGAWAIDIAPSRLNRDASAIKLDYTRGVSHHTMPHPERPTLPP